MQFLGGVRLRLRRRREMLLLVVCSLLRMVLRRMSLRLLRVLLLLLIVDLLLLWCTVGRLTMRLVHQQRAWRILGVEGLIFVGILRRLSGRLVALVLLLLAWLLLWLQSLTLVVVGAVLRYPALGSIAPLSAHPVEWGPILLLLRVGDELLLLLLLLRVLGMLRVVLGRHFRVVVLLQEWVEVVLVLLGRRGQMQAGALVPLLLRLDTLVLLGLLLCKPGVALPDRLAASDSVLAGLLRGVVVLVVA